MRRVVQKATAVLEKMGVASAPVPVEEIAGRLGAKLVFEPIEQDVSGMLYREGESAIIGVNSLHANTRQRFTIAHEIGHLLLHEGKPMFVDKLVRVNLRDATSSAATDKQEIEANRFAAELLMPVAFVESEVRDLLKRNEDISVDEFTQKMADRFKVSRQAMEIRLSTLGILDPA